MAAYTKSIERITTTFSGASSFQQNTVNLTKSQDYTKCVPMSVTLHFTTSAADARANNAVSVEMIDNAGTPAARITRRGQPTSPGGVEVHISIQEFGSNVTVQQGGPVTLSGTTATATITAVNQSNAFVIATQHSTTASSVDDFNDFFVYSKFNSNTEIQFSRQAPGGPDWEIYWYVVESNGTDFQTEYLEIFPSSGATGPTGVTLSNTVTLANAYIVCGYQSSETADDLRDAIWGFALTASDTLTNYRNHGATPAAAAIFGIWVVRTDSNGASVQRFATDTSGQSVTNQTITSVDTSRTALLSSNHATTGSWAVDSTTSGRSVEERQSSLSLTSATNVAIEKRLTSVGGTNPFLRFEVVEFEIESAGGDVTLVAESGAFSWAGQDAGLLYDRILGAESGDFKWSGQDATLLLSRRLQAESGAFGWTGSDANLRFTPAATLPASPGNYGWQGQDVAFRRTYILVAESGAFGWTGTAADLFVGEKPTTQPGGIPIRPKRKRRYILPDNRVFTDPDRALFELRQLLRQDDRPNDRPEPQTSGTKPSQTSPANDADDNLVPEVFSPAVMTRVFRELPALIQAQPAEAEPIDPQLLSVLFQRIDDEEAAILLL